MLSSGLSQTQLQASLEHVAVDCIALNYLGKHRQEMAVRGIN